jgi:hypothetical protein
MTSTCGSGVAGVLCTAMDSVTIPGLGVSAGQVGKVAGGAASATAKGVAGDVLGQIAQAMSSAADGLLKTLSSFWMNVDTPDLTGPGSPVAAIQSHIGWVTTGIAVVCILVAAARMAIRRRGEPFGVLALGLARLVIVCAAATFIVQAAGQLADTFSADLMSSAHLGSGGWSAIISTTALAGAFAAGDGMLLIIALLIIFSSLIQLMLMVLRLGLLVILTGTLPLAAAASMSDWGETWWRKHVAWLAAWLLYKPAAAMLYAGAFALTQGKRTLVEVVSGFMLLILSVLILPALLKVIVPMTASLGAASSGTLAMGAAGAVATGAIRIAGMTGTGRASAPGTADSLEAPSGNSVPAGGGPAGTATPRSSSDSAERAVVSPSGTQEPARGAGRSSRAAPSPDGTGPDDAAGEAETSAGSPPAGAGATPATTQDNTDATSGFEPSGAKDDGEEDQETGG